MFQQSVFATSESLRKNMMELVFKFYIRQFIRTNLLSLEAATRGALQKNELLEQPQACNFIEKETLV